MKGAITALNNGDEFIGYAVCKKSKVAVAKNKKNYCDTTLFDGETDIFGKIWDHFGDAPLENSILKLKGVKGEWNGSPQLTISAWRQLKEDEEVDPSQFMPVYEGDRDTLYLQLTSLIDEYIDDDDYREIVLYILEAFRDTFYDAPAAMYHHHAYLGGLLEHTVSTTKRAIDIAMHESCNESLLVAGAILHDIGKMLTYNWETLSITMTDIGKLVEHTVLGAVMLAHAQEVVSMPKDKYFLLMHLIVSHNGKKEWGSPVEPLCMEALILHTADMLDATSWKVSKAIETNPGADWAKLPGTKLEFYTKQ